MTDPDDVTVILIVTMLCVPEFSLLGAAEIQTLAARYRRIPRSTPIPREPDDALRLAEPARGAALATPTARHNAPAAQEPATKRHARQAVDDPQLKDFALALQTTRPELFSVAPSNVPNGGLGVFLSGAVQRDTLLCGYPGNLITRDEYHAAKTTSHYALEVNNTPYIIDATSKKELFDPVRYPIGHKINRPPSKTKANCKFVNVGGLVYAQRFATKRTPSRYPNSARVLWFEGRT